MHFTIPNFRPHRTPEPPAMVRVVGRSDVLWNRPVFKAPPLDVPAPKHDPSVFTDDIRRGFSAGADHDRSA
ncbi:MAG TPA: hypothetical protein VHE61_06485 [Opitutaceae bacterium]|nr:hypothetical protein [Opitutaceae bacterium]